MKELVLCFVVFVLQTQNLKRLSTVFKYERMNSLLGLTQSLCIFFYTFLGESGWEQVFSQLLQEQQYLSIGKAEKQSQCPKTIH